MNCVSGSSDAVYACFMCVVSVLEKYVRALMKTVTSLPWSKQGHRSRRPRHARERDSDFQFWQNHKNEYWGACS